MTQPEEDELHPDDEERGDNEELEGGEEHCPICDRLNNPGAADACEHYFGTIWDGGIMWSDKFDTFDTAWSKLRSLIDEEVGAAHENPLRFCRSVARRDHLSADFLEQELLDSGASAALVQIVDFRTGPHVETGGMVGGSGHSLYLESTKPVSELVRRIEALVTAVRDSL